MQAYRKGAYQYWIGQVVRDGRAWTQTFPFTEAGKAAAAAWYESAKQRLDSGDEPIVVKRGVLLPVERQASRVSQSTAKSAGLHVFSAPRRPFRSPMKAKLRRLPGWRASARS